MAIKRYKLEQIVTLLRQIEVGIGNGKTAPQACNEAAITVQTYYRWRKEYGGFAGHLAELLHRALSVDLVSSLHSDSLLFLGRKTTLGPYDRGLRVATFYELNGHPRSQARFWLEWGGSSSMFT